MKISWIGPWVSRIDWCEGHWYGSTYMAVRLSDICSKTGKKCILGVFRLFLSFCWTASQLYRLSQTNALRINQFYLPKDQSMKFSWKNIENWQSPKNDFCLVFWFLVFGYWVVQKIFFLVFLYEKNLGGSYEVAFIPALWMVSSESLKRMYPN